MRAFLVKQRLSKWKPKINYNLIKKIKVVYKMKDLYQIVPQFCLQTQTLCSELVLKMFAVAIQRLRFSVSRNLLS